MEKQIKEAVKHSFGNDEQEIIKEAIDHLNGYALITRFQGIEPTAVDNCIQKLTKLIGADVCSKCIKKSNETTDKRSH